MRGVRALRMSGSATSCRPDISRTEGQETLGLVTTGLTMAKLMEAKELRSCMAPACSLRPRFNEMNKIMRMATAIFTILESRPQQLRTLLIGTCLGAGI